MTVTLATRRSCALLLLAAGCLDPDWGTMATVSRATVHLDLADPSAPPVVDVALGLVGGETAHEAVLDDIYLGQGLAPERSLDLALPTPTVLIEPRSTTIQPLVPGTFTREDYLEHCQSALPITVRLSFADMPDFIAISPVAQLAIFCD